MAAVRIGAVSFLNTRPLVHGLQSNSEFMLSFDTPSLLSEKLRLGEIDVGLIPVVEYLRGVGDAILPGICIASDGPVRTVKLYSRVHPEKLTDIAVDAGSRSSVAMLRILLAERFGVTPDFHTFRANLREMLHSHEAALLIGDPAFTDSGAPYIWDLGQGWKELTNQPFVFAAWVVRGQVDGEKVHSWLRGAMQEGMAHLEEIALEAETTSHQHGHSLLPYLRDTLHYTLGAREVRGIETFQKLCVRYNIVPTTRELEFVGQGPRVDAPADAPAPTAPGTRSSG
ncbi:MAG: menaquinone biosynthesis protein [Candidatus Latescibacterota bacterium]|nr:MAG: menaquinone biosynthesis protein [Candidatus Latescibacterota bacterium]